MEVGIGLPSTIPGAGRHQLLEWARRAEARGFSTLGTIDRIVYPSHARGRILDEMLDLWARIWDGEEFGTAGGIGPRPADGRPALILGGWASAAFTRAARHGDGWTGGNCTLEELAAGTARLRAAWEAAAREGSPRTVVQPYYALGNGAKTAVESCLRDYYGLGDYTDTIVARAATDAETVRENVQAFAEAGCDELILFPATRIRTRSTCSQTHCRRVDVNGGCDERSRRRAAPRAPMGRTVAS